MAKVLRHILAVLCLLAAVFFLLPLGIGILHFGMVWPGGAAIAVRRVAHMAGLLPPLAAAKMASRAGGLRDRRVYDGHSGNAG